MKVFFYGRLESWGQEYKYLDSLPVEFISLENVEVKERPAPIKKDELFAG